MTRLLWKELRERWVLTALWVASMLFVSLYGHGQHFVGEAGLPLTGWFLLSGFFTVILGCTAYESEATEGRALCLFAWPISWRSVLVAKLLYAMAAIVGALVLATIISALAAHPAYRAFMTLPHLLTGIAELAVLTFLLYLTAMSCSVVAGGYAGGLMVLAGTAIVIMAIMMGLGWVSKMVFVVLESTSIGDEAHVVYDFAVALCMVSVFSAMALSLFYAGYTGARQGLTLSQGARIRRFVVRWAVAVPIMAVPVAGALYGIMRYAPERMRATMILPSPQGTYAAVQYAMRSDADWLRGVFHYPWATSAHRQEIVTLADGKPITNIDPQQIPAFSPDTRWLSDTILLNTYLQGQRAMKTEQKPPVTRVFHAVDIQRGAVVQIREIFTGDDPLMDTLQLSPDHRYLLRRLRAKEINSYRDADLPNTATSTMLYLRVMDLQMGKKKFDRVLPTTVNVTLPGKFWWQSSTEIGYLDDTGQRCVMPLAPPQ